MRRIALWAGAALIILLAVDLNRDVFNASAEPGGYELTWSAIDGGGGVSSGGSFTVDGSIGQPEAGSMSGGGYTLGGGFWGGGSIPPASSKYELYLPLVLK